MSKLPTPPSSRSGSEAPKLGTKPAATLQTSSELLLQLDLLLEQYLELLDQQQQLHSGLAKQMSSGFLSLAQANYSSPPGRRYGADYYDERMKATRMISICMDQGIEDEPTIPDDHTHDKIRGQPSDAEYRFTHEHIPRHVAETKVELATVESLEKDNVPKADIHTQSSGTESAALIETPENQAHSSEETKERPKKSQSDDPLHWYGVLVPFALRSSQKAFTEGIQNQVPALATVIVKMRVLEQRILRLRARLPDDVCARSEP